MTPLKDRRTGCLIEGCDGRHKGHGYCENHLKRLQRHGDPLGGLITDPSERFEKYIQRTDGCWLWRGPINGYGYGNIRIGGGVRVMAHRLSYERWVGRIPEGMHIDHLCRVRHCVNPDHLQPVTAAENDMRGRVAATMSDGEYAAWIKGRAHEWTHAQYEARLVERRQSVS